MPSPDVIFLWKVWPGMFACFTHSTFFNSPFCGWSNGWDQAFGIKCQAMIDYARVSFVYLGSFNSYRLRAFSHFSFVSLQEIGSTCEGRAVKPHHFTLSLAERSSEERTMTNDRLPSVVLIRPNIIRDESSKSTEINRKIHILIT